MNRAAGDPKGGPLQSFAIHSPLSLTPPFIFRFTWVRGRREGEPGRGGRGGERKARNAHLLWPTPRPPQPPPPAAAAAAAKPSRSLCTKAERSECRLALATPGTAAAGEPRAQCRSNLPCRPGRPRSALPPRPADPFKPPGLAAAAPGGNAGRCWGRGGAAVSGAAAGRPVR